MAHDRDLDIGVLREAGYDTAAFVGAYVLDRRFGLDQGFDTYVDDFERWLAPRFRGLVTNHGDSDRVAQQPG